MNILKNKLPNDPLTGINIQQLGINLRKGSITCKELTSIYCERIKENLF